MPSFLALLSWTAAAALVAPQDHAADPVKALAEAAKKLGEQETYSWTLKVEGKDLKGPSRKGMKLDLPVIAPMAGSRTKSGLTLMRLTGPGVPTSAVIKRDRTLFETPSGWKFAQALSREKEPRAYFFSTVLSCYPKPPDQVAWLLEGISELRKVGEGDYAGKLSPAAAGALLEWTLRGGGLGEITAIKNSDATLTLQVGKGIIARYTVQAKGSVTVGEQTTALARTLQVAVFEVNAVKTDAPDEAKKKLE